MAGRIFSIGKFLSATRGPEEDGWQWTAIAVCDIRRIEGRYSCPSRAAWGEVGGGGGGAQTPGLAESSSVMAAAEVCQLHREDDRWRQLGGAADQTPPSQHPGAGGVRDSYQAQTQINALYLEHRSWEEVRGWRVEGGLIMGNI